MRNEQNIHSSLQDGVANWISLSDVEAVRLVLSGNSVIDWNRANFRTLEEVDRFLLLHGIDLSRASDRRRIVHLHLSAVTYLEEHLSLRFTEDLRHPTDIRTLFVTASHVGGFRRRQILSCVILKLMHVIHHIEAAELRHQIPLAESTLLEEAQRKIIAASRKLLASELGVRAFYGSRKARNSVITKLLAKRENIAATIFDKLRFRIITEDQSAIFPALVWLTQNLTPFNYAIPGQSHNNLMSLRQMVSSAGLAPLYEQLQTNGITPVKQPRLMGLKGFDEVSEESAEEGSSVPEGAETAEVNDFSSSSYRNINFIVDVPVRVDHLMGRQFDSSLGNVVFVMVEFQLMDAETALKNEEGDSAHHLYKTRQLKQVHKRLRRGGPR